MEAQAFYQISLVAAFIAGMVALFAPCCISYLLPAYLGNIFKERKQILLMTFIYSLGIFVVMLPVVLGAKALSSLFFRLHNQTYIFGSLFLMLVAGLSFLGIKLPLPHLAMQRKNGHDVISNFTLGIFSGITSACCAPVLVGVITLSSFSSSLFHAFGVGASYVLGMVTPLYLASSLIHRGNILEKPILKKKLTQVKIFNKQYPIFVSNIVASFIFFITGFLMLILTLSGSLGMPTGESSVTRKINDVALQVTAWTARFGIIDWVFISIAIFFLYRFIRNIFRKKDL